MITQTSPLQLIELLGRLVRDAVAYEGRDRDLTNLRKVYALAKADDERWVNFLKLWAFETPSARCAGGARQILLQEAARLNAETHKKNFIATWPARTTVTQDGMYRTADGEIFKVQWNKAEGDGRRLYAKRLVITTTEGARVRDFTGQPLEVERATFEYAAGAMRQLTAEDRMTTEDAKHFGALYGTCVRCGKTLTLEESIERGMGSTCASKI